MARLMNKKFNKYPHDNPNTPLFFLEVMHHLGEEETETLMKQLRPLTEHLYCH